MINCSIYRPSTTDPTYLQNLILLLKDLAYANPATPIWIGGDLNLPNKEWSTNTIIDNHYPLILCDQILNFAADYGFLKQARAWFLKIHPVRIVCMRVCVCVCVCVCPRPRLLITSGVMWHDIDLI